MNIVTFEKHHIEEAKAIAFANYQQEQQFVSDLPEIEKMPGLNWFAENGENFITETPGMKNICGAFCLPQYRGTGLFTNLLNFMVAQLRMQGVMRLGVDYESINPTARGAWSKYFIPYTHSVVRRIDECALARFK